MVKRKANAVWEGNLKQGKGKMALGSGVFERSYSFGSRFRDEKGTNPEELIGAAHAGCFSMALANLLAQKGFSPKKIQTYANVNLEKTEMGFTIKSIDLNTEGEIPDITEADFIELAEEAKNGCPVYRALTGVEIFLSSELVK